MAKTESGKARLARWMKRLGVSHAAVAEATHKSPAAVYGWLNGKYRPEGEARDLLAIFSAGDVPAESWLSEDEREARTAVRPFAANDSTKVAS